MLPPRGSADPRHRFIRPLLSGVLGLVLGVALVSGGVLAHERNINCPNRPGEAPNCVGHEHRDNMNGHGGFDDVRALDGADDVFGHAHGDHIHGNEGNDLLKGGDGSDSLSGNQTGDLIGGGPVGDAIHGDDGHDSGLTAGLFGGDGPDGIHGEDGDDDLFGEAGGDVLFGGPGVDLCRGGNDPGDEKHGCEL